MRKLSLIAASSAAALAAVLIPGASTALAGTSVAGTACQYYTDFDFVGNVLSIYDSKTCNGVSQPAYAVIEKVGANGTVIPVAYGLGIVRYTCQGSTVNTYRFAGELNPQVILTPGALPCG
ncbi:hypothetical protein ACFO3J_06555 [Streptomyces polygonati]|uniref:Secreted protein n=1 Tax=Streptomyces polygonati TaxID=1617087 RepID=A0ABV8HHT7_9ACTN